VRKLAILPLLFALTAQTTPSQPMPKGTGLPPPTTDEAAVLAPINAIFAGFEAGDATTVLANGYPDGRVTAPRKGEGGTLRTQSWSQFVTSRVTPATTFVERISTPAIEIDGDVAMVWARFTVRSGGKLTNCGFDHFDLVRENGRWKVMNLTFSSNMAACEAQ
jgi:hypothetical protein